MRARKASPQVDQRRGKGSHVTLVYGGWKVVCPSGELKPGTLRAVLGALGLSEDDLR